MNTNKTLKIVMASVIIIVLIAINPIVTAIVNNNSSMKIDLTPEKLLSIQPETKTYLKSVNDRIKVYGLTNIQFTTHPEVIKLNALTAKLASLNSRLEYKLINLSDKENENFWEKYQEKANSPSVIMVIFEKGDNIEIIASDVNQNNPALLDFSSFESKFVNAVNQIVSPGAAEINIPIKASYGGESAESAEPAELKIEEKSINIVLVIYILIIPLLIALAGVLLRRKAKA